MMKNEDENVNYFSEPTDSGSLTESEENSIEKEKSSIEISDVIIPQLNMPLDSNITNLNACSNSDFGNQHSSEEMECKKPTQIIIIGTAHVSEQSVREVKETIEREKPDIVAVELDQNRYKGMTEPDSGDSEISFKDVLKPGQTFYYLLYGFLAYMQRKMGEQLGVPPGSEMMAAVESARENGAGIALIDRDIQVTFKRFLAKLSFIEKIKMAYKISKGVFSATLPKKNLISIK